MLERCMGVKGIEADSSKRNLSYNIVNTIGGKYLRALRRPNKGKKYRVMVKGHPLIDMRTPPN